MYIVTMTNFLADSNCFSYSKSVFLTPDNVAFHSTVVLSWWWSCDWRSLTEKNIECKMWLEREVNSTVADCP